METIEENQQPTESNVFSEDIKSYLRETAKWGKFLAVMGYIGMGLMVVFAIIFMVVFSAMNNPYKTAIPGGLLSIIYLVIAAVYYFPIRYLDQFSRKIVEGLNTNDTDALTNAFKNLKSLFKFMGICTIVVISIYALLFVFGMMMKMAF